MLKQKEKGLVDEIDPVLLKKIREGVRESMQDEIKIMRMDIEGCTEKCKLKNELLEIEFNRNF